MVKSVAKFVFSFRPWWSLFLVKLEAFAINGSKGNSDRVCVLHFSDYIRVCIVLWLFW